MNMSDVINDIKTLNSLNTIALPFKKPTETVIRDILQITLREYSRVKPYRQEYFANMKDLRFENDLEKAYGIFYLPEECTKIPVMTAYAEMASTDIRQYNGESNLNSFTTVSPFVGFGSFYPQDIINATATGAAVNKYAGVTTRQPSSDYRGYNKIQLIGFPMNCGLRFVVSHYHDENGESIPESCTSSFIQLGTLDVQMTIYNTLKNMNNIGSAFKDIQVKIDEWSGAEEKRNALLEKWGNTFHLDMVDELIQFF